MSKRQRGSWLLVTGYWTETASNEISIVRAMTMNDDGSTQFYLADVPVASLPACRSRGVAA
jgi:hypothetical protein